MAAAGDHMGPFVLLEDDQIHAWDDRVAVIIVALL